MNPRQNPIFRDDKIKTINLASLGKPNPLVRGKSQTEIVAFMRKETAADFLREFAPGCHIFGFTKGQFSLIDLLDAFAEIIPGADLTISTWTTARADLARLELLIRAQKFQNFRILTDISFQRRQPGMINAIRQTYGSEAVRITRNHAKFMLLQHGQFRIVVRTSMNLNFNPRLEDVDVTDDPELFDYITNILNEIWSKTDAQAQAKKAVRDLALEFKRF